jgi:N-formylglutamate amidohydrolase
MQHFIWANANLVTRHRGTMPIILTCPHDGTETPAGVTERREASNPPECFQFRKGTDTNAATITEGVATAILNATGLSPYVVIARFARKFIDANRGEACAFQDDHAKPFYDEYHDRISGYVGQILEQNDNRGFLFDIHGTGGDAGDPADIYLGTANGATLVPGFDRRKLFMQHGIQGLLKWARHRVPAPGGGTAGFQYVVSPATDSAAETPGLTGGFTVRHYGSRLNSIQIEIVTALRNEVEKRALLIEDLASILVNFVRRHAPF